MVEHTFKFMTLLINNKYDVPIDDGRMNIPIIT